MRKEIKSAKKLNKLPYKSAVIDSDGDVWQKKFNGFWHTPAYVGESLTLTSERLLQQYSPLICVHRPEEGIDD